MYRLRSLWALTFAASLATASDARGEARRIPLEGVLHTLFVESPAFRVPDARAKQAQGAHTASSGSFDLVATTTVQAQHSLFAFGPLGGLVAQSHDDLELQASLAARTRENVTMQLTAGTPLASTIPGATNPQQPQVTLSLGVPLLKFGRGAPLPAEERAAGLHARAAMALRDNDESELAELVAEDYWLWVGSREQFALTQRVEQLARDQLADVDQLIEQHARPGADRQPLAAAAENATASRIQAEQAMFEQRQALWSTLGLAPPTGEVVPADNLPIASAGIDPAPRARTAHDLARERPLIAYLRDEVAAAAEREGGARVGKRADLNLVAQATAARVEDPVTSSRTEIGYYGMVGLQFSLPFQNRAARGAYEQAAQARVEAGLIAAQRQNAIDANIDALCASLASLERSIGEREQASEQYRIAFENESTRFRLGSATAMNVVLAEQQYVGASLAVVGERTRYAVSLARLIHNTGALSSGVRARDAVSVARQLSTTN